MTKKNLYHGAWKLRATGVLVLALALSTFPAAFSRAASTSVPPRDLRPSWRPPSPPETSVPDRSATGPIIAQLSRAITETVRSTAMIGLIMAGAFVFNYAIANENVPQLLRNTLIA